ncbi:MAG TPA: aromatic ring-opening dioxygenase LigA [Tessaracoccus flavescens]|uniref:Aromatic ring-opening dioxygenase LigA n=1 Tax=Tessaracoccus flavescens TaxID=399497 RepID=A0A921EPC7_9ACTN|nr:aromatic ring-opening dioxygenase LigA [Tessaracoccus flavescens]
MKTTKTVGILSIIAGLIMIIAGAVTWGVVTSQLKAENITVPGDSEFMGGAYAGKKVGGPLSAYAQADIINVHALNSSNGETYATLGKLANEAKEAGDTAKAEEYTKQRTSMMTASFLRSSLFSSVIAYGVAALVIGLGVLFGLIGWALTSINPQRYAAVTRADGAVV